MFTLTGALTILFIAVSATGIGLFIVMNQFYTCPITKRRDFKVNMIEHYFFHPPNVDGGSLSHTAWYTKEGYEERFNCKLVKVQPFYYKPHRDRIGTVPNQYWVMPNKQIIAKR